MDRQIANNVDAIDVQAARLRPSEPAVTWDALLMIPPRAADPRPGKTAIRERRANNAGKPIHIMIGRRSYPAFGNSIGDRQMLDTWGRATVRG